MAHPSIKAIHPFVTTEYEGLDGLEILENLGWSVIDVTGDGNCGYYTLILGLENNGIYRYTVRDENAWDHPMLRNKAWQYNIMRLRHDLQRHSKHLLRVVHPRGQRDHGWFLYSGAIDEDEIENLSDSFVNPDFKQWDYFNGKLKEADGIDFQMSPYWTSYVFASLFHMRVIVYTRNSSWNGKRVSYSWSTTTCVHNASIDKRIVQEPTLDRMSDEDFNRLPTVEILFTTGFIGRDKNGEEIPESNHFQFLRRLNCHGVQTSSRINQNAKRNLHDKTNLVSKKKQNITNREKEIKAWNDLFDEQFQTSGEATATQMYYNPMTGNFSTRNVDGKGNFTFPKRCQNVEEFDPILVLAAREQGGRWMGPSVGDVGHDFAPDHLNTTVRTLYQQHSSRYCLSYSLASALFYCGFRLAAELLASSAKQISTMHYQDALSSIRSTMEFAAPLIGLPTLYGIRTHGHSRIKRTITWEGLFSQPTPYPTLVIPILPNGSTTHAFCIVDDLIFESSTVFALKLCEDSVRWIFNGSNSDVFNVLRFNMKISPKKCRIREKYRRQVEFHWDHPSKENM